MATDPEDDTLSYLVVVGAAYTGGFTVTNSGGQIQTGQKLNFEAAGSYLVRIQVSDPLRPHRHHRCDGYAVNDVAEAPAIYVDALSVTLERCLENSAAGVNVGDPVTAVDEDAGDTVSYSDDSSEFDINSSTGQVTVATGADLDHEGTDQYVFTATATDSTGLTDTIEVTVDITDVDERPTLVPDPTTISTGMGTNQQFSFGNVGSIQTISVTRQDNGGSIVVHTGQAGLDCASSVGGVSVASSSSFWVRYCTGGEVSLIVRDVGNPTTNFRVYTFSVAESNVAPVFDIPGQFGRTIPENSAAGTNVGDAVTATDADDGQTVSYSLTVDDSGNFIIGSSSGQITVATGASLDREEDIVRTVVVRASDDGTPQLHADKTVAITLSNVNEVPEFDAATAIRTVPENSAGDTNVGAPVEATDPDVGDTLTYTDDSDVFNVVNTSGQLQVHQNGASLDYEGTNSYTVTVTVNDAAGLSDSIVVTVNLTNVNEPPSFDAGGATTLSVAENSAAGTPLAPPWASPTSTPGIPRRTPTTARGSTSAAPARCTWPPGRTSTMSRRTITRLRQPWPTAAG